LSGLESRQLADLLHRARLIRQFVRGVDEEAFLLDIMRRSAVIGQIIAMAGTARSIPEDFRTEHPSVPWDRILTFGDSLLRGSPPALFDEIWEYAQETVPVIAAEIAAIFAPDE
jgi:uncharacterized protein with HEPN domain